MSKQLPRIIEAYFQAKNIHDITAIAACFAEYAVIHDEGEEIRGAEAIRNWAESTIRKYKATAQVLEVKEQGSDFVVTALVSGNFPGSPGTLDYYFTVDEKIVGLSVK